MKKMWKRLLGLTLCAGLVFGVTACGQKNESAETAEAETAESAEAEEVSEADLARGSWTREGYYEDEDGNFLSIIFMDVEDYVGWYVGAMVGEESYGGILPCEGDGLAGAIPNLEEGEAYVTIAEEGEDGVSMTIKDGETYHFVPMEEETAIVAYIETDGFGAFNYAEGDQAVEFDEYPYTSTSIGLEEPSTYVLSAMETDPEWAFVKWVKNDEDYSTERTIVVEIDEDVDYLAVFDYVSEDGEMDEEMVEEDSQNPTMNVVGPYACDRANAKIECEGAEDALITIDWASSASEVTEWVMSGYFDFENWTVEYDNCVRTDRVYDNDGNVTSETVVYEDGTGKIVFNRGEGSFTWTDDQEEREEPLVFEWAFHPES